MPTKIQGGLGIDKVQDGTVGVSDVDTELYGKFFGNLNFENYMHVRDEPPSGTIGGTATGGTWHTRNLNNVLYNTISGATLNLNQIILPSGTYYIKASAPASLVNRHRIGLYNIQLASFILLGTSSFSPSTGGDNSRSYINGVLSLSSSSNIEIRHYVTTTYATNGLGHPASITGMNEVYSEVEIWKIG